MKVWTILFPATIISLFLLFLGLKLGGAITWSWLWVSSPLWLPMAGFGFTVICLGLLGGLAYAGHQVK